MRLLIFGALLSSALSALSSKSCTSLLSPDLEITNECYYNTSLVTIKGKKNHYVDIFCDGETYTCDEIQSFDLASNEPLSSLGMKFCPPFLLQCVNDILNATSSQKVFLEQQTAPLTKEDVVNLGNVTELELLRAGKQISLPLDAINALPTLRSLRLNGARSVQLPRDGWVNAPPLKYLQLNNVELSELPPGGFRGLDKLENLIIYGNNIERIEDGAFEGLSSLRALSLSNNKLSSISAGALSSLLQLQTLMLTSNQLKELPEGLLASLTKLVKLEIIYNDVELTLRSHAFSNLPSLKTLKMYSNERIRTLPGDLFTGSTNIERLQLNGNRIEELSSSVFRGLSAVVRLDLSDNLLRNITGKVIAPLKNLQYLNLKSNQITNLPEDSFIGLAALTEIYLDNNKIVHIHSRALFGATSLVNLSLAHNTLTLDQSNSTSPFEPLENLKFLNLSGNQISVIEDFPLSLYNLEYLDLSYNQFTEIVFDPYPASIMVSRATVDLCHNHIRRITMPAVLTTQPISPTLLLENNPFNCDCHMYIPRLKVDEDIKTGTKEIIDLGEAKCASPQNLYNKLITLVSLQDFVCDVPLPNDNCTAIARPSTNELLLHCPVLPANLPDTTDENILKYFTKEPTVSLKLDHQPSSLGELDIHTLNLSHINIEGIQFKPTKHLKVLDVSYNNITEVPIEFLDANLVVNLSNNDLDCNCWQYSTISAIKNSEYVHGATCSDGQAVSNMDLDTLCSTWNAIGIGLCVFLSVAFIVFTASYLIYKNNQKLIIWMIKYQIFKDFAKEIVSDKDKTNDFFISYCEPDAEIVETNLVQKIEVDFKQKVCVHKRDWRIGDPIPTQIQESVEMSRRTIIFLSNDFLDSYWGNMEFSAAHCLSQKEQRVRVILILLDESVKTNPKLSPELKAYIETNTYLLYSDTNFNEKLKKILPQKQYAINWPCACSNTSNSDDSDISVVVEEEPSKLDLNIQLVIEGNLENVVQKDDGGKAENNV